MLSAASPSSSETGPPVESEKSPSDEDLEAYGWRSFEVDAYAQALVSFQTLLARCPNSAGGLQGRIACLRKLRNFGEAGAALDQALLVHPEQLGLLMERGWLALEQKNFSAAVEAFDRALATGRADEGAYLWKASLLRRDHKFRDADATLRAALRAFPQSVKPRTELAWLAFHEKAYDTALRGFDAVLSDEDSNASAWQGKLATLRKLERFPEAEEAARIAIQRSPNAAAILSELGWLAFDRGDFEAAERQFKLALTSSFKDPQLKVCLAIALIRQQDEIELEQAQVQCREALELDPELADAHGCLGLIAFQRGRIGEAERHLRHSTELDPANGRFADLGALYVQMGRVQEAERCFRAAIENEPADVFAHVQLGSLLLQQDKRKQALTEFRQAVALGPSQASAHQALAVGLDELGRHAEAEIVLRSALQKLDKDKRPTLHLALCQLLTRVGDSSADVRHYEDALKEAYLASKQWPHDAMPHFFQGVVKFKLGDLTGALKCFEKALERDPKHMQAELNQQRVRAMIKQEGKLTRSSRIASVFLSIVLLTQLGALWWCFVVGHPRISGAMFAALLPLLLGLLVVATLLPWLSRLKLSGLEAEMSVPKAKDALATGPKGEVTFGSPAPL